MRLGSGGTGTITNNAMAVTEGSPGIPAIPGVSGTSTALLDIVTTGSNLLVGFRATVGSSDDTVASERLSSGFPATVQSGANSVVAFTLSTAVTRLDVVGLNEAAYESGSNSILMTDTTAHALAELTTFTFPTAVSKIVVSMTPNISTSLGAQISVEGYSYA